MGCLGSSYRLAAAQLALLRHSGRAPSGRHGPAPAGPQVGHRPLPGERETRTPGDWLHSQPARGGRPLPPAMMCLSLQRSSWKRRKQRGEEREGGRERVCVCVCPSVLPALDPSAGPRLGFPALGLHLFLITLLFFLFPPYTQIYFYFHLILKCIFIIYNHKNPL